MNGSEQNSKWVDPDEIPELTDEFFENAARHIADKEVGKAQFQALQKTMGRPCVAVKRPTLSMRIDPDVLEALKASGKGWQTRVNAILRHEVLGR